MTVVRTVLVVLALGVIGYVTMRLLPSGERELSTRALEDERSTRPTEFVAGIPVVSLPQRLQREGGIETRTLLEVMYAPETMAYGEVVTIQPLLEQRTLYNQQVSEMAMVQAALTASENAYERLQELREERTYVSEGELQEAEARWASDQARLISEEVELRDLRDQMLQSWGPELTTWALGHSSEVFERLVSLRDVLLLITLRPDEELPDGTEFILVGRGHDRARYTKAYPISPAPVTDPDLQGETYFFHTEAGRLRTGMRIEAWIPLATEPLTGVELPVAAIVWHGGIPWVYVQLDDKRFSRRAVNSYRERGDSWFVSDVVRPEEPVVVVGAQMLLSEEFRWQIPEEDND